ncbi:uncharacterized protein [Henckelia pumila]|uniref:uncharacterized protein n=1 Tax=Henckelia pumila TaxID=405737 RepID=UPI003C6E78C4
MRIFKEVSPNPLAGGEMPEEAEDWLERMEQCFQEFRCTDEDRMEILAFILEGRVRKWCRSTFAPFIAARGVATWGEFRTAYQRLYFPSALRQAKTSELLSLRQVSFDNAPGNDKLICHNIQKDIVRACALETTNVILKDLVKEQLAVVLRFVDSKGCVVERLLGFKHVASTTAQALKCALLDLLSAHGLSVSRISGQGYDGASNIQGEINGLKTLILKENECVYYVHCFAHQLQLALVAVTKNHINIASLFHVLCNIVNVVGGPCKCHDASRDKKAAKIIQALENEEITKGRGLNQESTLVRPSDTCLGSQYNTMLSLIQMFGSAIDVLDEIVEDGSHSDQRAEALRLVKDM